MKYVQKEILRRVCQGLIADGYLITVDYERGFDSEPENRNLTNIDQIIRAADQVDECWLMVDREPLEEGPYDAFVYMNWWNDEDCLSDYTSSLEPIMAPIYKWIEEEC